MIAKYKSSFPAACGMLSAKLTLPSLLEKPADETVLTLGSRSRLTAFNGKVAVAVVVVVVAVAVSGPPVSFITFHGE